MNIFLQPYNAIGNIFLQALESIKKSLPKKDIRHDKEKSKAKPVAGIWQEMILAWF